MCIRDSEEAAAVVRRIFRLAVEGHGPHEIEMCIRDRNKNFLIIGGSGSGKTRFWLKPNLMQCDSETYPCSFVVTDPKGYTWRG